MQRRRNLYGLEKGIISMSNVYGFLTLGHLMDSGWLKRNEISSTGQALRRVKDSRDGCFGGKGMGWFIRKAFIWRAVMVHHDGLQTGLRMTVHALSDFLGLLLFDTFSNLCIRPVKVSGNSIILPFILLFWCYRIVVNAHQGFHQPLNFTPKLLNISIQIYRYYLHQP